MIHNHYCVKAPESYQGRDGLMEQGPKYMEIQRGDCPVLCTTVHLEAFPVSKVMAERLTSYTELLSISKGWGDKKKKKKEIQGQPRKRALENTMFSVGVPKRIQLVNRGEKKKRNHVKHGGVLFRLPSEEPAAGKTVTDSPSCRPLDPSPCSCRGHISPFLPKAGFF